ncbi:AlkZ family DNA glycosylase, partial [Micromonospora sp. ATA51]
MTLLSRRALNRALLQRQFLLERTDQVPLDVIRRLVALQAQEPNWPYVGLWSRIRGFTHADLTTLLADGQVVRSSLLRSTQHIAAADDFRRLRPLLQPVLDRTANSPYFRRNSNRLPTETLMADGRALLDAGPLARKELAQRLAARHPGRDGRILAGEFELRTPLIHDPTTASWGSWGNRSSITVTALAADTIEPTAIHELIRRYLAAFGPATVADVQAWSGLTRLNQVVADMGIELRHYTGPDGQTLLDLPDAHLPDPHIPAPVRLLPAYDNALLGHADRTRIISDEDRKQVMPGRPWYAPPSSSTASSVEPGPSPETTYDSSRFGLFQPPNSKPSTTKRTGCCPSSSTDERHSPHPISRRPRAMILCAHLPPTVRVVSQRAVTLSKRQPRCCSMKTCQSEAPRRPGDPAVARRDRGARGEQWGALNGVELHPTARDGAQLHPPPPAAAHYRRSSLKEWGRVNPRPPGWLWPVSAGFPARCRQT